MDETLLMIPGPTRVAQRVLKAMSENIVNHRSALFGKILTETTEMMSDVFRTNNKSYLLTGSGTAAMEAAVANIIEPGDRVLNVVGGKFGQRFAQIVEAFGGESIRIDVEWGSAVNPDEIGYMLEENDDIKAVTVVHNETSTGVANPIREIGKIMADYDALYIVDTVSSLGGDEVDVDGYGIDICVTGSQKCLAAPPGMAAITLSDDAWKAVESVDNPRTYYLNLKKYRKSGDAEPPETPYTPAVSLIYAMHEALKVIMEEGLNNRIKRHKLAAEATRNAVKALNLELFPDESVSSTTVTAVNLPEGVTDGELRGTMRNKYHVELAGGQDHLKGKIFRIGHMGNITHRELIITFSALEMTLRELGFEVEMGEAVAAVADTYLPEDV
ncbi:alanine--glyoxylate aminotransferase family protein [Methanothermobacter sp. K4]|uniref:pyridoxal-phosphate-dependent aminotransferase family protein n=1 Tax=Methanothermobacter sp. K4 TaxID=2913262 RepID=UPI001EDBB00A|nr:alanine--glyoxylate aminotransferase family protein [Methanothermobacter sp. K4]MCG2827768.1 alanine--glyoxylate aminotransferase family protein [Methanothermobacter sp. K4]